MHIAQSVVNRILNTADEIESSAQIAALPEPAEAPDPPDPTLEGASLDVELMQETPPVGGLPIEPGTDTPEARAAESAVQGGTPLAGLLDGFSAA